MTTLWALALLLFLLFAVNLVWAVATLVICRAVGAPPLHIALGGGPILVQWRLLGIEWSLCLILLGASAEFREPSEDGEGLDRLDALPGPLYALAVVGPWLLLWLVALALLGPSAALEHLVRTYGQLIEVRELPGRLLAFALELRAGPLAPALGLVLIKMVAFNLLPLPVLAGGKLLLTPWRRRIPNVVANANAVSLFLVLGYLALVAYHLVRTLVFG